MTDRKPVSPSSPEALRLLDDLIRRYYRELLKNLSENVKLGDFIKMIELRRKLAPADAAQKEFWKMLEKIRQEALTAGEEKPSSDKQSLSPRKGNT